MQITILVLEEGAPARYSIADVLRRAGYAVEHASDGEQALQQLALGRYRAVICDVPQTHRVGLSILRAAVALPIPPAVVLLTASPAVDMAVAALRLGAADYLVRPAHPEVLLSHVDAAIKQRAPVVRRLEAMEILAESIDLLQRELQMRYSAEIMALTQATDRDPLALNHPLQVGGLYLGRFPHESRYNGLPLGLTPIEHALLICLAEVPGEIVSYEAIMQRTHAREISPGDAQALLKSHVRNLRRKVGLNLVENMRRVGYRLAVELLEQPPDPEQEPQD